MLTDQHIQIIKSTIPLLEQAGSALTTHFYQRMFAAHPELQDIFNMSNQHTGRQQVALFEAIAAYAKNIENLAALSSAVERIAHKHTSLRIQPEHYAIVGHHLLETLRDLVPEQFTPEVEEAWTAAYEFLASIFIGREAELYRLSADANGGWSGTRDFIVKQKKAESALVTSFVFQPIDQKAVVGFAPGQYIGVVVQPSQSEYQEIRQYSLSDSANDETYRISVKRETLPKSGLVSNYLHDEVNEGDIIKLHPPAGDFSFVDRDRPVVLISAGVGITPMQSMLEDLAANNYGNDVVFLHACENSEQHSFSDRTRSLCDKNNWQQHVWYRTGEKLTENTHIGFLNFADVPLPLSTADFYLCGPVAFMQFARNQLLESNVPADRIHYEVFGPHQNL